MSSEARETRFIASSIGVVYGTANRCIRGYEYKDLWILAGLSGPMNPSRGMKTRESWQGNTGPKIPELFVATLDLMKTDFMTKNVIQTYRLLKRIFIDEEKF